MVYPQTRVRSVAKNCLPLQTMPSSLRDYVCNKKEYTRALQSEIAPTVYTRFEYLYQESRRFAEAKNMQSLDVFIRILKAVPNWGKKEVDHEVGKMPKIDGLYKGAFVCHVLVLTSLKVTDSSDSASGDITTTRPPVSEFVHAIYTFAARELLMCPDIFEMRNLSARDININKKIAIKICYAAVADALRSLVPLSDIYERISAEIDGKTVFQSTEKPAVPEPEPAAAAPDPPPAPEPEPAPAPAPPPPQPESVYGAPPTAEDAAADEDPYMRDLPPDLKDPKFSDDEE